MPIWQLCANLLIPNCLRSNLSYSPLAALELYVNTSKSQVLGTVPLYEYYSAKHINHSYSVQWKGLHFNTDDFQKIVGYVFPFED